MDVNRQWRVARLVEPGELLGPGHFAWQEAPPPVPADGEVLMRTLCLSTSPAQRGYISINRSRQLLPDLAVGEVMRGRGIGVVVESRHPDFRPGELYDASLGWQDYWERLEQLIETGYTARSQIYQLTRLTLTKDSRFPTIGDAVELLMMGDLSWEDFVELARATGGS